MRIDSEQRRLLLEIDALWHEVHALKPVVDDLAGSMSLKRVNGAEYLVRYWNDPATGKKRFKSLGRRDDRSHRRLAAFRDEKAGRSASMKELERTLARKCRVARAYKLLRLPADIGSFLTELSACSAFSGSVAIGGAFAVPAYEVKIGRLCEVPASRRGAPVDMAFFVEHEEEMRYVDAFASVLGIEEHDGSREETEGWFRIAACDGRSVTVFLRTSFLHGDLPDIHAVVVAKNGTPVPIRAIDPRLWIEVEERLAWDDADADADAEIRLDFVCGQVLPTFERHAITPAGVAATARF